MPLSSTSHGRQSLLRISAQYLQTAILGPSIMHFCPRHCVHTGRLTPLLSQWLPAVHEKGSNYRKAVIQGTPETFCNFCLLSILFVGNGKPTPSIPIPGPAWMDRSWALEALPDTDSASQAALVTSIRAWGQEPGINKKNCNQQSIQMPKQICPSLLARHLLLPLITCCSCHSVKNAETFVDLCAWHDLRPSVKLWYSLAYHIRPMYIIYLFITYLSIIDFNTIIVNIGMYIYIYHCHH